MTAACLDRQRLQEYVAGKSLPKDAEAVEEHLQECATCRDQVAVLGPTTDSLIRALRRSAGDMVADNEPELAVALAAVAAEPPSGGSPATVDTQELHDTGRLIRDYELRRKLGEGGMGAVYLALHTRLKKTVAIKLLKGERSRDSQAIARFAIEMEAVGKLEHPHIVRALDAGEEKGTHFLVMEYLSGVDMARLVGGVGRVGLADACELIRQAALGLAHAHENEVIHRDVKPSNLMVSPTGKVKVLDLGLAHFRPALHESAGLTRDNQVLGTLLYVAPEQLIPGGKVDARSDIYSLGVTLCELLIDTHALRQGLSPRLLPQDRALRPEVPEVVWQLATRMTAHDREERPGTMAEVAETLRPWAQGSNPAALVQQAIGQTSLSGVERLTPGGQGCSPLPQPPGDWQAMDVVPPPISTARLAPSIADSSVAAPVVGRADVLQNRAPSAVWMAAGVLCGVAVVLMLSLAQMWHFADSNGTKKLPWTGGQVAISVDNPKFGGLIETALVAGNIFAKKTDSESLIALRKGFNKLPEGRYTLSCDASEWILSSKPFTVLSGSELTLSPNVELPFPWLFPQFPTQSGETSAYDGKLWHVGMGGSKELAAQTYQVTLTALGPDDAARPGVRWLKIEVRDQRHGYSETGYLLVNALAWQQRQSLEVERGWLTCQSQPVSERLSDELGDGSPGKLVTEFNLDRDTLAEAAQDHGLSLPETRVGVHHVLALLFDAPCEAAPVWIRQVRPRQPSERKFSVETVDTPRWIGPCLVVHAETPGSAPGAAKQSSGGSERMVTGNVIVIAGEQQPVALPPKVTGEKPPAPVETMHLARNEALPFSFAKIDIDSAAFSATLKLTRPGRLDGDDLAAAMPAESTWREAAALLVTRATPEPFDRARLPKTIGAAVTYEGKIIRGTTPLLFRATLRTAGRTNVGEAPCCWLEMDVKSGTAFDHQEQARLLVDEQKYERGEFFVHRGWFIQEGQTFPFDPTDDTRQIEEDLRFLEANRPPARLSVHEVLTLLFGARLKAAEQLSGLRAELWGDVVATGRDRKHTWENVTLRSGRTVRSEIVRLEANAAKPAAKTYSIKRSRQVPFDFVEVIVQVPGFFGLETWVEDYDDAAPAMMGSEENLVRWASVTSEQLEVLRRAKWNWRLWTLDDKSRRWAEYGGRVGDETLLREQGGHWRRFSRRELADELDRAHMNRGRLWYDREGRPWFKGEVEERLIGGLLAFKDFGTGKKETYAEDKFSSADQELLKHYEIKRRPLNLPPEKRKKVVR